jgi:ABC-type tungstate transport system permease subunit
MAVKRRVLSIALITLIALVGAGAQAQDRFIVMASTTSTEQSGLFAHLLPAFKAATGIDVRVVAQGTGQALDMGRRGDADIVFVHDQVAEEKFVADGFGLQRRPVMYNDFVLIGPKADPAATRGKDITLALGKLAAAGAPFVSRGDKSGTHAAELRYWKAANVDVATAKPKGYQERLCAGRSRDLVELQEPRRPGRVGRRRQTALQSVWRHRRQPGQTSACEEGRSPGLRRLGGVGARAGQHRGLQDRRRTAVFCQREPVT